MKFAAIIPARYASTRFPGKPLADMGGKTMIQRVYERVNEVLEDVYVATDDERIFRAVAAFGAKAIMTSCAHKSGTDRCQEAVAALEGHFDVALNIQGDEPFIHPSQIEILMNCFDSREVQIATLVKPFKCNDGFDALFNPSSPKVVINNQNEAVYFSRSVIPYIRDANHAEWLERHTFYKHIGVYGYRTDVLSQITRLPQSSLEKAESLEQLRWIENGYRIKVGFTDRETIGIDTPEDMGRALDFLKSRTGEK